MDAPNDLASNPNEDDRRALEESDEEDDLEWNEFDDDAFDEYDSHEEDCNGDVFDEDECGKEEAAENELGDANEFDKNKKRLTRSFTGKKVLYELEESSKEEEVDFIGLDAREMDTSDEEFQTVRQRVIEYKAEVKKQMEGQLSEYEDSDGDMEILSENENEDDENAKIRRRTISKLTVGPKTEFKNVVWEVGLRFPNIFMFKEGVRRYGIFNGYSLSFGVSDKNRGRIGAKCKKGCPFFLYASWHQRECCLMVRKVKDEHTCIRDMQRNRLLTSRWLAKEYMGRFKDNPRWGAKAIMDSVRRRYGVIIQKWVAYKVKSIALRMLHGSLKQHYNKVGRYIGELRRANPGSIFELVTIPSNPPTFQRFFVCFKALKCGFLEGCRRLICLDGCHLRTFLGGILLAAIGRDGNNQMFPVCWAVVEAETKDTWDWFLNHLKYQLEGTNGEGYTFMSDQQKGLLAASASIFPGAEHRNCARHIYANWKKLHKGDELKLAFWKVVRAYTEPDFEEALEELKMISSKAAEDLLHQNPRVFCRAFFSDVSKCDVVVNNMAETFNGYIMKARERQLIDMLDNIRSLLMERMVQKQQLVEGYKEHDICPRIKLKLEDEKLKAWDVGISPSSLTVFQAKQNVEVLKVDIEARTCTCKKWDITGIPCQHAVAALAYMKLSPEVYVDNCYKKLTYVRAYAKNIDPGISEKYWPRVDFTLDPPPLRKLPGRPRKNRRKDPHEDPKRPGKLTRHGATMRCGRCRSAEHNIRRCPQRNDISAPTEKRSRGRPRKNAARETNAGSLAGDAGNGRGRGRRRGRGRGSHSADMDIGVTFQQIGDFHFMSIARGQAHGQHTSQEGTSGVCQEGSNAIHDSQPQL